jgi:cysteine-rich repeat protein
MRRIALALVLAAAGCGNLLGFEDPKLTDAGGGDDDGATDGQELDAPANTVVGRIFNRFTSTTGSVVETPTDASTAIIAAMIPDGTQPSGYRVVNGTGLADGTFRIDEVPDGQPYLLKIGRTYYWTTSHTIDQHFELPTRDAVTVAASPTPVTFNLTNMQPYVSGPANVVDNLEVDSLSVAYQTYAGVENASVAMDQTLEWRDGFGYVLAGAPLPVAAMGDDLYVFHTRTEDLPGSFQRKVNVTRMVDWFDAGAVTITDGAATTINGAFAPVASNRAVLLSYSRGNFDSAYPAVGEVSQQFYFLAHPIDNDLVWGAPLATVFFNDWSRTTSLTTSHMLAYGDPMPASWSRQLYESYQLVRWLKLPGTTTPRQVFAGTQRLRALPAGTPVLTPVLQPPGMLRIEGQDAIAGGKVTFDGVAPVTLSWGAVAGARAYQIQVSRVFANGSQTRTQGAATLYTDGTSIEIPAEAFAGGEFFTFTVASVQTGVDYPAGHLVFNGAPFTFARVPTGLFRLSSLCGNGTADTGEQCDTSGESATCDVDCSTRECGDGLRNVAAGEACDTVRDSLGCDSDCTMPVCGDGHLNAQLEDCDDGNTTSDGNGCSAECKFNNTCGDGTVQNQVEQCDGGPLGSAMCNGNCTLSSCGDGVVNPAANEQCDSGFSNGNGVPGGCSASCTINP